MKRYEPLKALLSVIGSEYSSRGLIDQLKRDQACLKSTLDYAYRNGLYYLCVLRSIEKGLILPESEKVRWDNENTKLEEYRAIITLTEELSQTYGFNYVLIKACNTIPHVPRDIDLFISSTEREIAIKAFEEQGMKCTQEGITETSLMGKDLKVDIYTNICYMGVTFLDDECILNSKSMDIVFGVPYQGLSHEVNLLIMVIHSLLGHRCLSLLDFLHIKNILNAVDINLCKGYAQQMGWGTAFSEVLEEIYRIDASIYQDHSTVQFPYFFARETLKNCVSQIDGIEYSGYRKISFNAVFLQDWALNVLRDTPIYEIIKSNSLVRNKINSITAYSKSLRGDLKSMNDRRN